MHCMGYFFGSALLSILSFLNVCTTDCSFADAIRQPFYAGSFYSDQSSQLIVQIDSFLGILQSPSEGFPRIVVVPHAGYAYSGATAARAYSLLAGSAYTRVVLIGVSHKYFFDTIAVDDSAAYRTPLGDIPVDLSFVTALTSYDNRIRKNSLVHKDEHSLEVELPFLQRVLGDFSIVPILLSRDDGSMSELLANVLTKLIDDNTLVVVSTDLSHYPPKDIAERVDDRTLQAILNMNISAFDREIMTDVGQLSDLSTRACGAKAVRTGMLLAQKLGLDAPKLLHYSNSADVKDGDPERVVGYASMVFMQPNRLFNFFLTDQEKREALMVARETLKSFLKDGVVPNISISSDKLKETLGVFVTLNKNGQLRGCIGQFTSAEPLWQVIQSKAVLAATADSRFIAVTEGELDDITVEISVISPMRKIFSADEIEMGKHGVYIRKGDKAGTYLPHVAKQFQYNKTAFLDSLAESKVGIDKDSWRDGSAELYVYEAYVFSEEG